MDKQVLVATIIAQLEKTLQGTTQAALEAAQSATDDEAKSESKYDTRGLEASYLASGQAHYAKELKEQLDLFRNLKIEQPDPNTPVHLGSLITTLSAEGRERFFMAPAEGGLEIEGSGSTILVITPKSPIGSAIIGKQIGTQTGGPNSKTIIGIE